ncbi:type I restriction/modification system N-6 DNA methyltransferase [Helicobacter fennelliae]|uniref:Type I restriction/modification system N-6 DNA methyltransferase n=1 Tax=Helicobacter fennelliae TaxID=215 RepID=A0A2X3DJV4_9HELI|nr:restriction endonuclease subunit S [Helicobacter fennelliae]SQB99669.1 type I restriction/modification system N-6 DNA methyltransferase [Helicobacter fennelliae]
MQNLNESLQAKYPHLELAILPLSQVNKDNESKRIDSEYFKKEYLEKINLLSKISTKLENLMASGYYGILPKSDDYLENGLSLVRGKDIREFSLEISNLVKVPYDYFQERYQIHKNDILFLVKGATIGYEDGVLFILEEPNKKMIFNGSVFKLQVKNINPAFLYVFMMTKYFTFQKVREVANNGIEYNSLPTIKNFLIPQFSQDFQLEIEKLVKQSHEALEDSKRLYKEAQELLYKELELDFKNPLESLLKSSLQAKKPSELANINDISKKYPHLNISVRPLSKSLHKSGRLDSEYYQSKYDLMETKIKDYKGGYCKLQPSEIKDFNFTPKAQEKYRYIELANIGNNGNISEPLEDFGENLPTRARRKVKTGDFIMSSIEGSLTSCALITPEFDNCVVSTGFYVLNSAQLNGETLLVLFKCEFFQEYLKKFPSGTILTAISKDELQNILIPKINPATQEQIALKIQKSFTLRAKSKDLLESAKVKVEQNIQTPANQA